MWKFICVLLLIVSLFFASNAQACNGFGGGVAVGGFDQFGNPLGASFAVSPNFVNPFAFRSVGFNGFHNVNVGFQPFAFRSFSAVPFVNRGFVGVRAGFASPQFGIGPRGVARPLQVNRFGTVGIRGPLGFFRPINQNGVAGRIARF